MNLRSLIRTDYGTLLIFFLLKAQFNQILSYVYVCYVRIFVIYFVRWLSVSVCVLLFSVVETEEMSLSYYCSHTELLDCYMSWQKQRLRWWRKVCTNNVLVVVVVVVVVSSKVVSSK